MIFGSHRLKRYLSHFHVNCNSNVPIIMIHHEIQSFAVHVGCGAIVVIVREGEK